MAALKRKFSVTGGSEDGSSNESGEAPPSSVVARKKRRVVFQDVTVFYFNRRQGFVCVPSQGGNTLGMEDDHFAVQVLTLDEHLAERRASASHAAKTAANPADVNVLMPVDSKERRTVLRSAGVEEIDVLEKEECRELRMSRQHCGCTCVGACIPTTCHCAAGGIMCQVDRPGFPCGCTLESCNNPTGRLEFNPVKVRTHFLKTIMRCRLEEARYLHQNSLASNLGYLATRFYGPESAWTWDQSWPWTSQQLKQEVKVNDEEDEEEEEVEEEEEESSEEDEGVQVEVEEEESSEEDEGVQLEVEGEKEGQSMEEEEAEDVATNIISKVINEIVVNKNENTSRLGEVVELSPVENVEVVHGKDGYSFFQGIEGSTMPLKRTVQVAHTGHLRKAGYSQVNQRLADAEHELPCFSSQTSSGGLSQAAITDRPLDSCKQVLSPDYDLQPHFNSIHDAEEFGYFPVLLSCTPPQQQMVKSLQECMVATQNLSKKLDHGDQQKSPKYESSATTTPVQPVSSLPSALQELSSSAQITGRQQSLTTDSSDSGLADSESELDDSITEQLSEEANLKLVQEQPQHHHSTNSDDCVSFINNV